MREPSLDVSWKLAARRRDFPNRKHRRGGTRIRAVPDKRTRDGRAKLTGRQSQGHIRAKHLTKVPSGCPRLHQRRLLGLRSEEPDGT
ncbi:Hypothetical protein NTJ_04552 [Nesidiocoris tenuis]|uniref:Uncharacterized protein n=1 Tax=Nesidiocoris tenuis TaxID=355587 RepID=A0ABN7AK16_9HEMI|nr:Hypothetical protein NTJ_04552 [Nesidiocoris tenuis]